MKKRIIGIVALATVAGASVFALARGVWAPASSAPFVTDEPTLTMSTPGQCYFVWATQELTDLSAEYQTAVQTVAPEAEARAAAFGENCVAADGSSTFGAMETDFYISLPVPDLADAEQLGTIIGQALVVTDGFARPRVPGGQDGFVEFTFRSGNEQRVLRVPIPRGRELRSRGLRGAELFQALQIP